MNDVMDKCPACGHVVVGHHCGDTARTCTWQRCRDRTCGAVFDPRRGRGYVMEGSKSRVFTFGATS
jgi:hypothetical protein